MSKKILEALRSSPVFLDCTLRDGSYEVNFQFDYNYTKGFCRQITKAGVKFVEVGHGVGLGASRKGIGVAAEPDEKYMQAAAEGMHGGFWGMFCIPGIADLDDIDLAAKYGMDFIRVGVDLNDVDKLEPYLKRARENDLFVFTNFMKSYVSSPENFLKAALKAKSFGAQGIYVVDSAGGMLEHEVGSFVSVLQHSELSDLVTGFHGHNNLGLAVSNTLFAHRTGAKILDVSLRGLGRSSGNASFEKVLATLIRYGSKTDIDVIELMKIGDQLVAKYLNKYRDSSIDVVSGMAQFHSSYFPTIEYFSRKYQVDPRQLIIKLCEIDKVNAPEEIVEEISINLREKGFTGSWSSGYRSYNINEQDPKI